MLPPELKKEWLAKWRRILDDNASRMDNPEAYRMMCRWETRDMSEAGVIDEMEQFEMDELADAAYWHAVEELVTTPVGYTYGGYYDVIQRATLECIGYIRSNTYYSAIGPGADGFDGKVFREKNDLRLVFRNDNQTWAINGLVLTAPSGELYDLVQTAQFIYGKVYPAICDADTYRALVDCAQVALECRDFESYRKARPLLLFAQFTKCGACLDRFGQREDCSNCAGNGFVSTAGIQPTSSA
jgi:hypothetical protein